MEALILLLGILYIIKNKNIRRYKPKWKGKIGEYKVNRKLNKLPKDYVLLKDILLESSKGKTAQIDHIVVSPKGVFVIETKNYKGLIYGDHKERYWTQVIDKNTYNFYNPVIQNLGHIKAIKEKLNNKKDIPIYSIVAFNERCKLKKIISDTPVLYTKKIIPYIKNTRGKNCLKNDEIKEIVEIIKKENITDVKKKERTYNKY